MTLRKKVASALSFAHLTGFAKAAEQDDEKDRREDAEGDDPEKKDDDTGPGNGGKSKKATEKDDESDDDSDPEKKDDVKKAKKAKAGDDEDDADAAEDDDEDKDEEMRGKSSAAAARRRERARCAAIFSAKAAGMNPALAASLAFNTTMTRKEAIGVLESTPSAAGNGLPDRAARNPSLGTSASRQTSQQAVASGWDAAIKKVTPRR
jgi:hypothetical protein